MKYWEDFQVGDTAELGSHAITQEEIVAFARKFDPQPFHLDPAAARRSIFGGLIASGWHTCAIMMRLFADPKAREDAAGAGPPGREACRLREPAFP